MSLTPLEKELLGHVKRLSEASEASAKAWNALEAGLRKERADLENCLSELINSQSVLIKSVSGLMTGSTTYESELEALEQSERNLMKAEAKLSAVRED